MYSLLKKIEIKLAFLSILFKSNYRESGAYLFQNVLRNPYLWKYWSVFLYWSCFFFVQCDSSCSKSDSAAKQASHLLQREKGQKKECQISDSAVHAAALRSLDQAQGVKGFSSICPNVRVFFCLPIWLLCFVQQAGYKKKLWKKLPARRKRLREIVFCNKTQSKLLDKMTTSFWKRRNWYVNDPYKKYHDRVNLKLWITDSCFVWTLLLNKDCIKPN